METKFKLIPLYRTDAVLKNWHYFSEGMERVMVFTNGDTNLTQVLNEIMAGETLLWLVIMDDEYRGFLTTKITQTPFGVKSLWLVHLWLKPGTDQDVFLNGLHELNEFARLSDCNLIRMYTLRDKGFVRKLLPMGWKTGYQEFTREVKASEENLH